MTPFLLYAGSGMAVLAVGLCGLFMHDDVVRKILAANIAASGVFLVLVALARRSVSGPPDPVPHALVLTGVVVSVSATALALAIVRRLRDARDIDHDERDR